MEKIRRHLWKRWCAGAAAACLAAAGMPFGGLPEGAAGAASGSVAFAEEDVAMGRYIETNVTLPEELDVRDVVRTAEGTLRIIGQGENGYTIWDSADGGESWEQTGALPQEYAEHWFSYVTLNPDGGGAAEGIEEAGSSSAGGAQEAVEEAEAASADGGAGAEAAQEGSAEAEAAQEGSAIVSTDAPELISYTLSFDAQGNVTNKAEHDSGYIVKFTQDGQLLACIESSRVAVLDRDTCEIQNVIAENANMFGSCGQEALVFTAVDLQRYDLATGEPLERDEALDDALYADAEQYAYMISTIPGLPVTTAEDEEGRLYYCTKDGIFAHAMGGSVVEQVVDGTLCSFFSPSTDISALAVLDQCFYLVCSDGSGGFGLVKYEYSADTPSVPQREITIYSMRENPAIRQMAVQFQKGNPDAYVNYEVGLSGGDGVTVSDALRTLNTEILAGSGPDVLIMDEMTVGTYADQGLLTDLSGVAAEIQESEGLLENVIGVYERDGILPAIPARFGIVLAAGESELVSGLDSLEAIESAAAQEGAFSEYTIGLLPDLLYRVCAGAWKNEDNTLDQEKLAEYVSGVKSITDTWTEHASEESLERMNRLKTGQYLDWNTLQEMGSPGDSVYMGLMELAQKQTRAQIGALYSMSEYCGLTSVNKVTGDCAIVQPEISGERFFVPCCLLGVLSTSQEQELAAGFVRYVLSSEGQTGTGMSGFPVNLTAFDTMLHTDLYRSRIEGGITSGTADGGYFSLEFVWPEADELDALLEMAQQVTAPVESERVQHDVVIEEMNRCLNGGTGVDDAVSMIMQRINLYLAE